MTDVIVLAMHGAPPTDFPTGETAELFTLHFQLEHMPKGVRPDLEARYAGLEEKMRHWPRSETNDPFYAGSMELAEQLRLATGRKVILGFNEFCAPSLEQALAEAANLTPERVVVVTPMMTRGGEHSEVDIPTAVRLAQEGHPEISFAYVWPFNSSQVASFLADQIQGYNRSDH
jgi:sirohydrochlorin cobaltochelatase